MEKLFVDFDINVYKNKKPPKDDSLTTFKEIKELESLPINKKFVEDKDNLEKVFSKASKKNGVEYPAELVREIIEQSRPLILKLKHYFYRPRPKELAKKYDIELKDHEMSSMNTPAYPSGHSAQGILLAKVMGKLHPNLAKKFMKEGEDISYSRNIAKAHYKSDSELGKKIGEDLYNHIKDRFK